MKQYKYQWRVLTVLFGAWGVIGLVRNSIAYLFPYFSLEFALSDSHMGFLAATLAIFWSLSLIISGKFAENIRKVTIMIGGLILAVCCLILVGFVDKILFLYLLVALIGFGCGPVCVPSIAIINEQSNPQNRGMFIGVMQSAYFLIGGAVGSVVLTKLGDSLGWRSCYLLLGVVVIALVVTMYITLWKIPEPQKYFEKQDYGQSAYKEILKFKNIIVSAILTCACMMWTFTVCAFTIIYLMKVRGFTAVEAGSIFAAFGIGGFLGGLIISTLSDYLGRKLTISICALFSGIAYLLFLSIGTNLFLLMILLFLAAFFFGGLEPIVVSIIPSESVPANLVPAASAFPPSIGEIVGGVIAPITAGLLINIIGLNTVMYGLGIIPLTIIAGVLFLEETAPIVLIKRRICSQVN